MPCPSLDDLPAPPPGRTGWPWTAATPDLPERMPDGAPWPKISIVTPSFNQGAYIEETIRSVLLQGYPNLEYIIIDGGSTDGAVDIIKKYAKWLTYWVSEKDSGQANAVNKGLALCTGDIFQFINSDDILLPDCLENVGIAFPGHTAVVGDVINFLEDEEIPYCNPPATFRNLLHPKDRIHHPGVWVSRIGAQSIGMDESYWYYFDLKFMATYFDRYSGPVSYPHKYLVKFRLHSQSKTVQRSSSLDNERSSAVIKEKDRLRHEIMNILIFHENRKWCSQYISERLWQNIMDDIIRGGGSRTAKIIRILTSSIINPRIRLSRNTAKSIIQIIVSTQN